MNGRTKKSSLLAPTIGNVLDLFARRLKEFKGESLRSYRKAYSSFQIFSISHYPVSAHFNAGVVENWVVSNLLQGLSKKTVAFYLDKISSLYSSIAHRLVGAKSIVFKEIKVKLKNFRPQENITILISAISDKVAAKCKASKGNIQNSLLLKAILEYPFYDVPAKKRSLSLLWASFALKNGVLPSFVKSLLPTSLDTLKVLDICQEDSLDDKTKNETTLKIAEAMNGKGQQWFAMRLRPRVKFETLLDRFSAVSDVVKVPELFYPLEEIAQKLGRKVVWKGKPIIRDVVFFKTCNHEIYPLFTHIYDLAWCYRVPGSGPVRYAAIPEKAMEDFKVSLGFITPDFEVFPAGELKLKKGDEVVIVNGEYARRHAKIIQDPKLSDDGNVIYRVSLLNLNGHWDIGIDARLLKKV